MLPPGAEFFYNKAMERLLEMLGAIAAVYIVYKLGMGKWDYTSPHKRNQRKTELKEEGLSTRFYFMQPRTQWVMTAVSGGLFTFYWVYAQWKQIASGFKRLDGSSLEGGAFRRAVGSVWSMFALMNIINRTCEYMHKRMSWPSWLWGTLWLAGLVVIFCPVPVWVRVLGYIVWCSVPVIFQRRLNTLTHKHISAWPRAVEIIFMLLGMAVTAGIIWGYRFLMR